MTQAAEIAGKLLPCPFCGREAELKTTDLDERNAYGRVAIVKCVACDAQTGPFLHDPARGYAQRDTADPKAIAAWNTRAPLGLEVKRILEGEE